MKKIDDFDWKEATYGTWFIKINDNVIYWNRYDDYFKINNDTKQYNQKDIQFKIEKLEGK